MALNSIPVSERKSRLRVIRKNDKPDKNAKLVNLRQTEEKSKVLMPPPAHQYIKPKDHDFL